ncbi:hypothetical protein BC936DRAFT_149150 [Jimgerdemannia flammicorona]|uniref:Carboxylesterase type B domain-containing protein n=1 Tax=Jimgerdemannia flammicorona TaxID=994334 RepID=A0A433D1F9_9FUNG|nr:hypothetical protein BC936DRAFT_149150 [Jimgerdemannia flammicorona]
MRLDLGGPKSRPAYFCRSGGTRIGCYERATLHVEFIPLSRQDSPLRNPSARQPEVPPSAIFSGVRNTTTFAPGCLQPLLPFQTTLTNTHSEDCLYLNSDLGSRGDPHQASSSVGGCTVVGWCSAIPTCYPTDGRILNFHKRGFCEELGIYTDWYPVGDCELNQPRHLIAFEWVLREISKFGGDPKKVTAFDESSGGSAINYHLAAQGGNQSLFSAAILESGVADVLQPPAGLQGDFDSISNLTGCISPVKGGLPPRP